ncbi:MAG: hypothetical protein ABJG68_08985 [Crocinitomicaceae bacterium]
MNKYSFIILTASLLIFSCKKEKDPGNYKIEVKETAELSDSTATLVLYLEYPDNVLDVQTQLTFGMNSNGDNPEQFDFTFYDSNVGTGGLTQLADFENLFANQTYYAQAQITSADNDIDIWSEIFSFTTKTLPPPDCNVPTNQMDIDGYVESMSALELIQTTAGSVVYRTTCSIGNIDFSFEEEPKSGIYKATDDLSDFGFSDEKLVLIGGYFDIIWNCYHSADNFERIHVENNNGNISITLCDVNFSPHGGTCTSDRPVTGQVQM